MRTIVCITVFLVLAGAGIVNAQMGEHMMGEQHPMMEGAPGGTEGYPPCQMHPGMGYGRGPGMMHGGTGYGMGCCGMCSGMMHGGMGLGMDRGMMMGPGMCGHSPREVRKFLDDTVELRRELHSKKFDYFETLRNPDAKDETIEKLEAEMRKLWREIMRKKFQ